MADSIERALQAALTDVLHFGQILIRKANSGFILSHRDDGACDDLQTFRHAEDAVEIAKYDNSENYRPLKTAPNLRRGWRLELRALAELTLALDYFYPGRLAVFVASKGGQLHTTPLRQALDRQSGMYRVAAKISNDQIDDVVADFCRSNGGCLRTILWKRDQRGAMASTRLPSEKFDPTYDQLQASARPGSAIAATSIPLLCQEPCNLLVAECREAVKGKDEL